MKRGVIRIYVGTYAKYNRGSVAGQWLSLPMPARELRNSLSAIAGGERSPEFMIQGYEVSADFRAISESEDIFALNREAEELKLELKRESLPPEMREAIEEYRKVWPADGSMLRYCVSKLSNVYRTEAGSLIEFDKPSIETSFCFNEDINGRYDEETADFARHMASEGARKKEYFIAENLEKFRPFEELLEEDQPLAMRQRYCGIREDLKLAKLVSGRYFEMFPAELKYRIILTVSDVAGLRNVLEQEKQKFRKRLETWWKRYGASGIRTWTYCSD